MSGLRISGPMAVPANEGELRFLAAKIATSYARANPLAPAELPAVIRLAYSGLLTCANPPTPAPEKPGRSKGAKMDRRRR